MSESNDNDFTIDLGLHTQEDWAQAQQPANNEAVTSIQHSNGLSAEFDIVPFSETSATFFSNGLMITIDKDSQPYPVGLRGYEFMIPANSVAARIDFSPLHRLLPKKTRTSLETGHTTEIVEDMQTIMAMGIQGLAIFLEQINKDNLPQVEYLYGKSGLDMCLLATRLGFVIPGYTSEPINNMQPQKRREAVQQLKSAGQSKETKFELVATIKDFKQGIESLQHKGVINRLT